MKIFTRICVALAMTFAAVSQAHATVCVLADVWSANVVKNGYVTIFSQVNKEGRKVTLYLDKTKTWWVETMTGDWKGNRYTCILNDGPYMGGEA